MVSTWRKMAATADLIPNCLNNKSLQGICIVEVDPAVLDTGLRCWVAPGRRGCLLPADRWFEQRENAAQASAGRWSDV